MTIYALQQRLKNYNLNAEIVKAIKVTKDVLLDFNRSQLMSGRNALNLRIQPRYRTKGYAKSKNKRNRKPGLGVPDLFNDGNFQEKLDVKVRVKDMEFTSLDYKTPMLTEKYHNILGVTAGNMEKYVKNTLHPKLTESLKKALTK